MVLNGKAAAVLDSSTNGCLVDSLEQKARPPFSFERSGPSTVFNGFV